MCKAYLILVPQALLQEPTQRDNLEKQEDNGNAHPNGEIEVEMDAEVEAWLDLGIELCLQGKICLAWTATRSECGMYSCISAFGSVMTKLCRIIFSDSPYGTPERRKAMQSILDQILDILPRMQNEYSEIISMCILSNYIDFQKSLSGRETVDIVFDHTRYMVSTMLTSSDTLDKQNIETLLYCILTVCLRFIIKLHDALNFFRAIMDTRPKQHDIYDVILSAYKKVEYAVRYNVANNSNNSLELRMLFGKPFFEEHPIFKNFYTSIDDAMHRNYIKAFHATQDIVNNLHDEDPFNVKMSQLSNTTYLAKHVSMVSRHKISMRMRSSNQSFSTIVSQPSDPLTVLATYVLVPEHFIVQLHLRVHNTTRSIDMYQVSVEIGVEGSLNLFEQVAQPTHIVGDLPSGNAVEFNRVFRTDQFSLSRFFITIRGSHVKQSMDADLLKNVKRKDDGLIAIRCKPFQMRLFDFLRCPVQMFHQDFLTLWELFTLSLQRKICIVLKTHAREDDNGDDAAMVRHAQRIIDRIMVQHNKNRATFRRIVQRRHVIRSNTFQLCYATRTLFDDYILVSVMCTFLSPGRLFCNFEFRTGSEYVMQELLRDKSEWFVDEMMSNVVKYFEVILLRDGMLVALATMSKFATRTSLSQLFIPQIPTRKTLSMPKVSSTIAHNWTLQALSTSTKIRLQCCNSID